MILPANGARTLQRTIRGVCVFTLGYSMIGAQPYAGVLGGISTLSGDARSVIEAGGASASSYKPENGGVVTGFGGMHLNDFLSLQGNYTWNRNNLALFGIRNLGDVYEQSRRSTQHSAGVDLLLYFRGRRSWVRPFLSAGAGVARFKSGATGQAVRRGNTELPPDHFSSTKASIRVAVGIDLRIARGWAFRYSFLEAIQGNPISPRLSPPGVRNLATFQNLFGVVRFIGN